MKFFTLALPLLAMFGSSAAQCGAGRSIGSELTGRIEDTATRKFCSTHQGFFADPFNCRVRIICNQGVLTIEPCPAGQMFNPAINACQATTFTSCKQRKLYCADKFSPLNGTEEGFEEPSEELTNIGNAWPVKARAGGNRREAENSEDDIIIPPHIPAEGIKPPRGSVEADQYNAIASIVPTTTVTCAGKGGPFSKAPVQVAAAGTPCPQFTFCIRGTAYLATCAGGLQFDVKTHKCLPSGIARCAITNPPCANAFGIQQIPGVCDRYMVCCNNNATIYYCKPGFSFDTATMGCTLAAKATCTPT